MSANKIVSGGERGRRSPASGPALQVIVRGAGSVRRRSGRRLTELFHAVDWGYVGFMLAVGATAVVVAYIGLGRGA